MYLIGRRGPLQAAFTIKELREMLKLENCCTYWSNSDFKGVRDVLPQLARPRKRLTELMLKSLETTKQNAECNKFKPVFFRSPLEFLSSTDNVEKLKFCVTKLTGPDILRQTAICTENVEHLKCDLAVTSIGYRSLEADPEIPFDSSRGIAKNANGKISDGVFTTGWLATGPTGVILSTMSNAFGVAEYIVSDLKNGNIESKPGFDSIQKLLEKQGVQLVYWKNWLKIDAYEQEMGKQVGKPREKIVTIEKMLEVAE